MPVATASSVTSADAVKNTPCTLSMDCGCTVAEKCGHTPKTFMDCAPLRTSPLGAVEYSVKRKREQKKKITPAKRLESCMMRELVWEMRTRVFVCLVR